MVELVRNFDWRGTPIGPRESWPHSLGVITDTILSGGFPAIVLWGPDLIQIYNDGYRKIMGGKHPAGLGQPTRECWPEVWAINEPIYERVRGGETVIFTDALYPLARNGRVEDVWLTLSYSPLRDDRGTIAGVLVVLLDVTDRVVSERDNEALRQQQEFLLRLTDALRPVSNPVDMQNIAIRMLGEKLGVDRALYYRAELGRDGWAHIVDGEYYRTPGTATIAGTRRANRDYGGELFAQLEQGKSLSVPDLASHPMLTAQQKDRYRALGLGSFIAVPLHKEGRYVGGLSVQCVGPREWNGAQLELVEAVAERTWSAAERARAEAALLESEERSSLAIEAGQLSSWDWDIRSGRIAWNDRHYLMQGYEIGEITPSFEAWLDRVHPDDRERALEMIEASRRDRTVYSHTFRTLHPDGTIRWCAARGNFFYDETGQAIRMIGVMEDVTERKHAEKALQDSEKRARLLLGELQHRVRNTLSIVRSIARRTAESSASVEDYKAALDGRLDAFSRTQALVTRDPLAGLDLEYIVAEELRPYGVDRRLQFSIRGPRLRLRPKAAETMALAIHELATNAAKYGALSVATGRVDVAWEIDAESRFVRMSWAEKGGPSVTPPGDRRGLGTELIEQMLVYDLDARTLLDFAPSGLRCTIELPFEDRLFKKD
jgi:PAS domain S-box-containing protein